MGWSLGGQIALRAALVAPDRFARLMLVCSSPRFIRAYDWPHAMLENTLHQFAGALKRPQQTLARFYLSRCRAMSWPVKPCGCCGMSRAASGTRSAGTGTWTGTLIDGRSEEQLNCLKCPSFWLLGGKDALVPGSVEQDLINLHIPEAGFRCLKGCAHALSYPIRLRALELVNRFFGTTNE